MSELTLPNGWIKVAFSNVTSKCQQKKPSINNLFTYIDIGSINRDTKKIIDPKVLLGKDAPSRARKVVNSGDVLVSLTRPNLNAVALINTKYNDQIASTGFEVLRPVLVNSSFVYYTVQSLDFINKISKKVQGALYPAAKTSDVQSYKFALPPLAEQNEIAQLLQQNLAQVEQIKANLAAIPKLLTTFRQSVLADAVSGKLTVDLIEPKVFEETLLNDLIVEAKNGISKRKGEHGEMFNVLRLADFSNAIRIYGNERQIILDQKELEKYSLETDDILVIRVNGSEDLAGKFIHYTKVDNIEAFCDHLIRLRLDGNRILPAYLLYITNIGHGRSYLKNSLSTSAGQNTINQTSIKNLSFRLPPLNVQIKIVERVEELFAFADNIERQVQSATEHVNLLTQSILAKAFRGELTADWRKQNPELISGENSAEALLAKIQAQMKVDKANKKTKS